MKIRNVVIDLHPDRIDLVICDRDRCVDARSLVIAVEDDACEWAKTIRRSAASLKPLVERLKLSACPATVLYRTPTQVVELRSFAVRSSGQAVEAALLSCADSLPYSSLSAVSEAAVVGRDAGGERQVHVVATAEREDVAEAIQFLVEESGLKLVSATPLDAAVMANLIKSDLAGRAKNCASLYVGSHASFFVVADGGTLLFSRRIDLGLESLAHSLTRPLSLPGRDEPLELGLDEARTLLQTHGIPARDTVVHAESGLTGAQIMPLLQPVLQRFIVELRQSIRFGLSENARAKLALHVTGPGSALTGLPRLIGQELNIETTAESSYAAIPEWNKAGAETGELADALCDRALLLRLNMLPQEVSRQRRSGRLRRWLWTGAAAAIAIVAVDGARYHLRVQSARQEAAVYASHIAELTQLQATGERLRTVIRAQNQIEKKISDEVGVRVDYHACMQELSRITPPTIRFTSLRFERAARGTIGTLSGCAFSVDAGRTDLEPFIEALRSSPLFDDVVLGNVNKSTFGSRRGERFEASYRVIPVPHDRMTASAPADERIVDEGAMP